MAPRLAVFTILGSCGVFVIYDVMFLIAVIDVGTSIGFLVVIKIATGMVLS